MWASSKTTRSLVWSLAEASSSSGCGTDLPVCRVKGSDGAAKFG